MQQGTYPPTRSSRVKTAISPTQSSAWRAAEAKQILRGAIAGDVTPDQPRCVDYHKAPGTVVPADMEDPDW